MNSVVERIRQEYDLDGITTPEESAEDVLKLFQGCDPSCDLTLADVQAYLDELKQHPQPARPKLTFRFSLTAGLDLLARLKGVTWERLGAHAQLSFDPLLDQAEPGQTVQVELQAREVVWYGHRSNPQDDMKAQWTLVHENGSLQPLSGFWLTPNSLPGDIHA